mgnify:CR=1 FL=1
MRNFKIENDVLYLQCTICLRYLQIENFHKHPKWCFWRYNICKKCHHEKIKIRLQNNPKHNQYKQKVREKYNEKYGFNWWYFHKKTHKFVHQNNLLPERCDICWKYDKIQIHHPWYRSIDDRKYVCFVCPTCHTWIHKWWIPCSKPIDLTKLVLAC